MPRLYHDFNKLFPGKEEGMAAAPLVCVGTKEDLKKLSLTLEDGMDVLLYMDDEDTDGKAGALAVKAKVRYDPKEKCFMADFIWNEMKFHPEALA
jgi:hypothetical protein